MIEIIREEASDDTAERRSLPKDIKQMGKPDIGERIYVENEVYQFLHPYSNVEEKSAYVLLGRFEHLDGRACVFIEAAIYLEEIVFDGDFPVWNDQTWAYIYRQLRQEFDNMVIVGWAMDIKGQLPNMTMRVEQLHQSHFGGAHQVLFLMDSLEREEAFYGNKNGHLFRRDGFYVYYEKKEETRAEQGVPCVEEKEAAAVEEQVGKEEQPLISRGSYRKQLEVRQERKSIPSYASTLFLASVVCILGFLAYSNGERMKLLEQTLLQMNHTATVEAAATEPEVKVENIKGNVQRNEETKQTEESEQEPANVQEPANAQTPTTVQETTAMQEPAVAQEAAVAQESTTVQEPASAQEPAAEQEATVAQELTAGQTFAQVPNEAQTYLSQGYYIVQKGDSMVGICKKVYQTTAMMDKLCEVNGIDNPDAIYAGQKIILPN